MIKLICPLLLAGQANISYEDCRCGQKNCAWWIEDKQKCAIAVGGDRKNGK